jgi:DNA processing protein
VSAVGSWTPIGVTVSVPTQPLALGRDDERYPERLKELEYPPAMVWAVGDVALAARVPAVAIVGTRSMTPYGERVTRQLAGALARAGACIVSGMARGIDSVAHRAALECGGSTIAVLGTGADVAYPPTNRALHRQIAERGLILSEYPPGSRAYKSSFIERNRLIAALSSLTIVVEAGIGSGALHTADAAEALSRTAAMVPGPIDSPQSFMTNDRIREGRAPITSIDEALFLAGLPRAAPATPRLGSDAEHRVWKALDRAAPSLDVLCARVGLPTRECLEAVTTLELQGVVECALTGEVRRRM